MANDWLLDEPSPSEVTHATFQTVRRGYDPTEVQAFARAVGTELERLAAENAELRRALAEAEERSSQELDEGTIADYLGEETTRLLQAARDTASGVVTRAEDKARTTVDRANTEAERIRAEAQGDAAAERTSAREEARRLVTEATANRQQVLAELARRRDRACDQIDDLLGGRDVLVQALAQVASTAGELIGRLDSISADPADFVNLDPTGLAADGELPVDRDSVLHVTKGKPGTSGTRGTASDAVEVDDLDLDEAVIVFEDDDAVASR